MLNQPQHNGHILAGSLDYGPSSGNIISASSSRMFTNYEISDDLTRVHLQHLERKYGGRMRAHNAATKIQRAFRHYRLDQLYRQQVLGHPSARRQTGNLDNSAFPNSALQKSTIERSAHFRQLAKSQPSLKYQPVTSLRAQLQAERHVNSSRPSYQLSSPVSNIHSPRHVHPLKNTGQQRPYMELMSPRLSQRRAVCPNTSATSTFIPHTSSPRQNRTLEDSPLHHGRNNVAEEIQEMVGLKPSDNNNHYFRSSSPLHSAATTRGSSPHQQGFWLPRLSVLNNSVTNSDGVGKHSQQQTAIYHSNSLPRMGAKVVLQGNNMPVTVPARQTNSIQPQHNHQQQPHKQMREWTDQQRRRLYRIALNFFNKKPDRGIQLLIGWGFVDENPRSVAKLFVERRGLSKQMIGEFLGTIKSPFHNAVLESFFNEIPMYDMEIDRALRQILTYFRLPGEAQKIDHIMQAFSKRYRACNPSRLPVHISADTVYILAFAIIMLNTDLHSPSLKDSKRMKLDEFVKNIRGIEEGKLLDKQLLHGIYERVKEFEFRSGTDHVTQVMKVDQSIIGKDKPKLVEPHRRLICYCRLHQIQDANKKQAPTVHQREIFLFNDLMLIAKVFNKKKSTVGQYTLRSWSTLIGMRIEEFQNAFYSYGLLISCPDGQELLFNAKNNDDRYRFMADVRESVAEATEMEQLRLEMELDKQSGRANGRTSTILNNTNAQSDSTRTDTQRDSGLPDLDQPSPVLTAHTVGFNSSNGCIPPSSPSTVTTTSATPITTPIKQANGVRIVTVPIPPDCSQLTAHSSMAGCASSASLTNGATVVTVTANTSVIRRLSFNSLDSGMVEETNDFSV